MDVLQKMLFTIVEDFGVADREAWINYLEWRGMQFERFDSLIWLKRCQQGK